MSIPAASLEPQVPDAPAEQDESSRWVTATLEAVATTLLRLQSDLPQDARMHEVFDAIRPVLYRLCEFHAMAFASIDEDGLGFRVEAVDDPAKRRSVIDEIDHQIAEGTFAWSLYQGRPVVVRGGPLGSWILLHALSTPTRPLGMFLAALPPEAPYLPDAASKALSIVLMSCASVLESAALYRQVSEHNARLEDIVAARTAELRRSEKAAHRASRVKSEFLANMSHEMRTPLNGITGMASLLETTPLDGEQKEQVSTIVSSADHLVQLISDLLDSAKAESGQLDVEEVWFDLRDVTEEVVELLAPRAAERRVELIVRYLPGMEKKVCADPVRVRQVVTNLVGNAVKFTERGSIVVTIGPGETDGLVQIDVADTGIGIEQANVAHVFDAFAQADSSTTRRFGGTGLGLSIGRTLARLMGGDLSAASEVGVGSTFTFTFRPVGIGAAQDTSPLDGERAEDAPSLDAEVILVASDRDMLLASLGATILDAGGAMSSTGIPVGEPPMDTWGCTSWSGRTLLVDCGWEPEARSDLAAAIRRDTRSSHVRLVGLVPPGDRRGGEALVEAGFDQWLPRPVRARRLIAALKGEATEPQRKDVVLPLGPCTILIADDNPVNLAVARKMVQTLGGTAQTVTNGREAIEAIGAARYDVVLMDCQMPVMDGYEATAALRRAGSGIPIIALTASDRVADRERSISAGMDRHLAKPLTLSALRDALSQWIGEPDDRELEPIGGFLANVDEAPAGPRPLFDRTLDGSAAATPDTATPHSDAPIPETKPARSSSPAAASEPRVPSDPLPSPGFDAFKVQLGKMTEDRWRYRPDEGTHELGPAPTSNGSTPALADGPPLPISNEAPPDVTSELEPAEAAPSVEPEAALEPMAPREPELPDDIDPHVFDVGAALERTGDDMSVLVEIVEMFVEMWPSMYAILEKAQAAGDPKQLVATTHRIKGAALNLGANALGQAATRAEDAFLVSDIEDSAARLAEIEGEFRRFAAAAERLTKGAGDG